MPVMEESAAVSWSAQHIHCPHYPLRGFPKLTGQFHTKMFSFWGSTMSPWPTVDAVIRRQTHQQGGKKHEELSVLWCTLVSTDSMKNNSNQHQPGQYTIIYTHRLKATWSRNVDDSLVHVLFMFYHSPSCHVQTPRIPFSERWGDSQCCSVCIHITCLAQVI